MPTTRKPEVIVREIEQTRAELADAIDAITNRINPRRAASRGARAVREQVTSEMPSTVAEHKPRPAVLAVAGIVALVGLLLIRRRH
ncbi:MAG TPA: DUF3618 domain-containing protein [Mycobacteriales bacterium]|nr:DUF3618 domain-containing protein [Mycobacteriales bacterium]